MSRKAQRWAYGLAAGFLTGLWSSLDGGLALMLLEPGTFNLGSKLNETLKAMLVLGILCGAKIAVAYLKNSPLPPMDDDAEETDKTTNTNTMKMLIAISLILGAIYAARATAQSHKSEAPPIEQAAR